MTIDERFQNLKERHEALAQSVEMMVAENKERDKRLAQIMDAIAGLVHVAEIHDERLETPGKE